MVFRLIISYNFNINAFLILFGEISRNWLIKKMEKNLFFKTFDQVSIRYCLFSCQNRTEKGTVLVLHGRGESLNKYDEVRDSLLIKGYNVAAFDWRGQGLSDRPLQNTHKHHHTSFDPLVQDLDSFITNVLVKEFDGPFYILAHSMGGHIALRYLVEHKTPIKRAVLSAPFIGLRPTFLPKWIVKSYIALGNTLGFGQAYATPNRNWGAIERSDQFRQLLTHDKEHFARDIQLIKDNPGLALGGVTFGWLAAALRSCDEIQRRGYGVNLTTPILIAQASEDVVVDNGSMTYLAEQVDAITLKVIKGASHEIMRETDAIQEPFWRDFDEFMK